MTKEYIYNDTLFNTAVSLWIQFQGNILLTIYKGCGSSLPVIAQMPWRHKSAEFKFQTASEHLWSFQRDFKLKSRKCCYLISEARFDSSNDLMSFLFSPKQTERIFISLEWQLLQSSRLELLHLKLSQVGLFDAVGVHLWFNNCQIDFEFRRYYLCLVTSQWKKSLKVGMRASGGVYVYIFKIFFHCEVTRQR